MTGTAEHAEQKLDLKTLAVVDPDESDPDEFESGNRATEVVPREKVEARLARLEKLEVVDAERSKKYLNGWLRRGSNPHLPPVVAHLS